MKKRLKRCIIIFAFFLLTCAALSSAAEKITKSVLDLEFCIRTALEKHPDLLLWKKELDIDRLRVKQKKRNFLPETSVALDRTVVEASYYDPEYGFVIEARESRTAAASINQPLFTGFRLSSELLAEEFGYEIDRLRYRITELQIILTVKKKFLAAMSLHADHEILKDALSNAKETLELARRRLEMGKAIPFEVLQEEAYKAEAEYLALQSENSYKRGLRELLNFIGLSPDQEALLEMEPVFIQEYPELDKCVIRGLTSRPEMPSLEKQISRTEAYIRSSRSVLYPQISFFTQYRRQWIEPEAFGADESSWDVGLTLTISPFSEADASFSSYYQYLDGDLNLENQNASFSLFDGAFSKINIQNMKKDLYALQLSYNRQRDKIINQIKNAWEKLNELKLKIKASEKKLEAAEENLRVVEKQYKLGIEQYQDLIDARSELVARKTAKNQAMYEYAAAIAELEYAVGIEVQSESRR